MRRSLPERICRERLNKVNILHYYRKLLEKSRSFFVRCLHSRRIDIFLFIVAILVLATAAAGQVFKRTYTTERIDIVVSMQHEHLLDREILGALIEEYERHNPNLRILLTSDGIRSPETDGRGADIVFFDDSQFSRLVSSQALASLAPYGSAGAGAQQWALPLVLYMDLFIYNIDLLQAANRDRPPRTRAEFLAVARELAAQGRAFPLALGLDPSDPLALRRDIFPWIWAADGELYMPGSEGVTLSRIAEDTIAFFGQLHRERLLAPESFGTTGAQRLEEFSRGTIAMLAVSSQDLAFLRRNAGGTINFDITAMPTVTSGRNRLGLSGIYVGITTDSALPDKAWAFLTFIADRRQVLVQALDAVPGSFTGAFPDDYISRDPFRAKAWDIFEAADIVEFYPVDLFHEEIDLLIRERLAAVIQDGSFSAAR